MTTGAKRQATRSRLVATKSFCCAVNGHEYSVIAGVTRVESGHELLADYSLFFAPAGAPALEIEDATAEPGAKRGW
jgi:hypothetical protein